MLIQHFGMEVSPNAEVESIQARIIDPPTLMYGQESRLPTVVGLGSSADA